MNLQGELESLFIDVGSKKVTERKKALEKILQLLSGDNINAIKSININWSRFLHATKVCLKNECEKIVSKQGVYDRYSLASKFPDDRNFKCASELFCLLIKCALQQGYDSINISNLVRYIAGSLSENCMNICRDTFFVVLKNHIFSDSRCLSYLEPEDFICMYELFKLELNNDISYDSKDLIVFNCFMLLNEHGPHCGLPSNYLRQQFEFISKFCQSVKPKDPRDIHRDVMRTILSFSTHTVEDNRLSCTKLGEEIFYSLLSLYNSTGSVVKETFIEWCLLQITIHNPEGIPETDNGACAFNWHNWNMCIKQIYTILQDEIFEYLRRPVNMKSFFVLHSTVILDTFTLLFVEVCKQLFSCDENSYNDSSSLSNEQVSKRRKIETNLESIIDEIQNTKSWIWIALVGSLLKKYPNLIKRRLFTELLKILQGLQCDERDNNTTNYVFQCLGILIDVQKHINVQDNKEITNIWKLIGESLLSAVALYQNIEASQALVQKMITHNLIDLEAVVQMYKPGLSIITKHHLRTAKTIFAHANFAELANSKRKIFIDSLLNFENVKDYKCFLEPNFAFILVCLTLKQYPKLGDNLAENKVDKHQDLKTLFKKSSFNIDDIFLTEKTNLQPEPIVYNVDDEMLNYLLEATKQVNVFNESTQRKLCIFGLLYNLLQKLMRFNVISEHQVEICDLALILRSIATDEQLIESLNIYKTDDVKELRQLLEIASILDVIWSWKNSVTDYIKGLIPLPFLKNLFEIIEYLNTTKDYEHVQEAKQDLIKALSKYCLVSSSTKLNHSQGNILVVLSEPDYDFHSDLDFSTVLSFLACIKYSNPGILQEDIINNILECLDKMISIHFRSYKNTLEILPILKDIYMHLDKFPKENQKRTAVNLLKKIYDYHIHYDAEVVVAMLSCVEVLCRLDPDCCYSKWDDMDIIKLIPDFLASEYQKVRYKAINVLVNFMKACSRTVKLTTFHRLEELLSIIYDKNLKVFEVEDELTEERRQDELHFRTATSIYVFASMIINCPDFIDTLLFDMVKLEHEKRVFQITNEDLLGNILSTFESHFKSKKVLDLHLPSILIRWIKAKENINLFPFVLFNCEDKMAFYRKYYGTCLTLLFDLDKSDLLRAGNELNKTETNILEEFCAKLFAKELSANIVSVKKQFIEENPTMTYLQKTLGRDRLIALMIDNIEDIILNLLFNISDSRLFHKDFQESIIFVNEGLSFQDFSKCYQYIEDLLYEGQSMMDILKNRTMYKVQNMIMTLQARVHNAISEHENKLKYFHQYCIFIDMVSNSLQTTDNITIYFLRDTIHYLIYQIKSTRKDTFQKLSLKYLDTFLKRNIPSRTIEFEEFAMFIINSLKNLATSSKNRKLCIDTLEFLIIQNKTDFINIIRKLETFPVSPEFHQINEAIKNVGRDITLKQEIESFLDNSDISSKQDSLIHLKELLATEKNQVKELYDELDKTKYYDYHKGSILQQLICALVKMSGFPNKSISIQAVRCLGELGPANLTSLFLQTKEKVLDIRQTPFQYLTGHILYLLTQYIVDPDLEVIKTSSAALYSILKYKDARKIAASSVDFGHGKIRLEFLAPFLLNTNNSSRIQTKSDCTWMSDLQIWIPSSITDSNAWIQNLVSELLGSFTEESFIRSLVPLCKIKPKFCESIFPLVVYCLFTLSNNNAIINALSKQIDNFFTKHMQMAVTNSASKDSIALNKKAVQSMLGVINFIREQSNYKTTQSFRFNDLKLNYLAVSKAAAFCSAHFTALLYGELWCRQRINLYERRSPTSEFVKSGYTLLDYIYENEDEENGIILQDILQNAYKEIGDLDSLLGCGSMLLLQPEYRIEYYKKLGQWDKVQEHYSSQQINYTDCDLTSLVESLKMNQLYQVALRCSESASHADYECLWRLGQWTVNEENAFKSEKINPNDYNKFKFDSLKALIDGDKSTFVKSKEEFSASIIETLKHTSLECSKNIYPVLMQLQSLVEMEDFMESVTANDFTGLFKKWEGQDSIIRNNDFQFVEPIVAQRMVLLSEYVKKMPQLQDKYFEMILNFADYAKNANNVRVAQNAITRIRTEPNLGHSIRNEIELRESQIAYLNNDKISAQQILRGLCNTDTAPRLKASALKLQAEYEIYFDRETVLKSFSQSIELLHALGDNLTNEDRINLEDTYDKFATFADKEYQQIVSHMKSDIFRRKESNVSRSKENSQLPARKCLSRDENKAAVIQEKFNTIEENEINTTKTQKGNFLNLAVENYLKNLALCDTNNIKIFRVMSLLLDKENYRLISNLNTYLSKIPTYKYIMILPQLIPHISQDPKFFSKEINTTIERCAKEHPHHTLPLLFSLVNANKDQDYTGSKTNKFSNDRIIKATAIVNALERNSQMGTLIKKMRLLTESLIELAYYTDPRGAKESGNAIPKKLKIHQIKDFNEVLVPTCTLAVSKSNSYENIEGIVKFSASYKNVGGINAPKRIECLCTSGVNRSQLVKGQDDLRQDAVMQQVFNIMTDLLASNKQTRNMQIRTYKIVPLSMRSGILEWAANSMPIGYYLIGNKDENYAGAHIEFRPNDMSPTDCRRKFASCAKKSFEDKQKVFSWLCQRFKPVFHKFFETHFVQPSVWYEKRKAYTRSVATNSMCGYILGIGDRHVSNILIDKESAELVHIDFGIAFEQGKCLPTPETIPFRLSRDIVDGMGVSGVEGLFRKSCEKTMEVLRSNAQTILAILEVLLYDPLYFWTVTPAEANKRQTGGNSSKSSDQLEEGNKNISAESALLRLRGKLQGTEEGKPTSIENQVGALIQQAMDPANLCRLYAGWQPYL